jgi:hypothetical protein
LALLLLLVLLPVGAEASPKHKKKKPAEAPADDLLAAPAAPAPAAAVEPGQRVDSEAIKAALAAYDDLDYARCVSELQKALGESLTRDEKVVTYRTLAFCHVGLDKPDAAKFDFENLLRIDESYELDRRISPRIRAPFEEAKAAIATGESVEGQANEIQFKTPSVNAEVAPKKLGEGKPFTVSVRFSERGAAKAELFYRVRGQAVFNKLATPGAEGTFNFTVPGMQVGPPAVDYYVNVLDDSNTVVAHAGVLSQPLSVPVSAQKRPVYVRGWFWGVVVGAVAVAAAVVGGTVAATTGGSSVGKNTSASVTIVPR